MITYTYIVKCPECEDEFFDFFEEAKEFALGCMSKKPIITQTEVNRNDFGECTDHCDLGTVWSWEDMMGKETDAEPTISVFTKDDLKHMTDSKDPEFDAIDNSVDFEIDEVSETPAIERKPIPDGMTIEQLVEEMEENEDAVECVGCEELHDKAMCFYKDGIGWLCGDCEDRIVRCTWCEELFDKDECRYEVDLHWLCSRCEMGIKSRGETLTFKEGNYWDFLDEELEDTRTLEELVKDSINHLTNDLGKDPWADDFADDVIKDIENNYDSYVPEDMEHYNHWCSAIASEVSRQVNNSDNLTEASLSDIAAAANSEFGTSWDDDYLLDKAGVDDDFRAIDSFGDSLPKKTRARKLSPEEIAKSEQKEFESERQRRLNFAKGYVKRYGAIKYNDRWPTRGYPYYDETTGEFLDGEEREVALKKLKDEQEAKEQVEAEIRINRPIWFIKYKCNNRDRKFITHDGNTKEEALAQAIEYIKELAGEALAKGKRFDWNEFDVQVVAGRGPGGGELRHFEENVDPEIVHDLGNEYDGAYPAEKPNLPEIDEVSDSHLKLCPECGKEAFDMETGICVECGFN